MLPGIEEMIFTRSYAYRFRFSFTYGEAGRLAALRG